MIKVLHLEPTDVCQAACPLCARETDSNFDPSVSHHLSMQTILDQLGTECLESLDKMFMCGNYGDPAAGKNTLDIYRQFRKLNPTITLGMNTNAGLQNADWWQSLAQILCRPRDYVVFSIDGLEDTNHIYRQNVQWRRVMENAQSFIMAGGSAHWDMLIYAHNQHQVDACRQLARDMGFKWFRTKVSKRQLTNGLKRPINWLSSPVTPSVVSKRQLTNELQRPINRLASPVTPSVRCHALQEQSLYMDARGITYPCCWHGHRDSQVREMHQVQLTWNTETPNQLCLQTCGTVSASASNFENQWRQSVEL